MFNSDTELGKISNTPECNYCALVTVVCTQKLLSRKTLLLKTKTMKQCEANY